MTDDDRARNIVPVEAAADCSCGKHEGIRKSAPDTLVDLDRISAGAKTAEKPDDAKTEGQP